MSQYEKLDNAIIEEISARRAVSPLYAGIVTLEAKRIASLTGREAFRIIDGRLQALRKKGIISYKSSDHRVAGGWSVCEVKP